MSVFAAAAMALPPRYSSTTRQPPPPYKQGVSQPLIAPSIPPPVYRANVSTTTTISPRSSSPSPSIATINSLEPPQYASIISAPRPNPPPSATCQSRLSASTWKHPYVQTDAAGSVYELEQRTSRQREQQQQQEEEEEDGMKNWCRECFWWYFHIPSDANGVHWSAYGLYIF